MVHVCTIVPISMTVGANRIVPAVAIPYPLGDPNLEKGDEKAMRKDIVKRALKALTSPIEEQTLFDT